MGVGLGEGGVHSKDFAMKLSLNVAALVLLLQRHRRRLPPFTLIKVVFIHL